MTLFSVGTSLAFMMDVWDLSIFCFVSLVAFLFWWFLVPVIPPCKSFLS